MGRSVSYPRHSVAVCYRRLAAYYEYSYDDDAGYAEVAQDAYDYLTEWVRDYGRELFPSMTVCDEWLDREDRALLRNGHAYIGVSVYGGLVAVWLVPRYTPELAVAWCKQVAPKFEKAFEQYRKVATFSNGESVYEPV